MKVKNETKQVRVLVLGAGAAGLFLAAHAGPDVLVVDHAKRAGEKIRISGGGRCNFTNLETSAERFLSQNHHFAKSALARFGPWDFIDLLAGAGISWHEKTLGQLFCDGKSTQIVSMLQNMVATAGADLWLETSIRSVARADRGFHVVLEKNGRSVAVKTRNLVLATGGKSIPKMGATGQAYDIAQQFGIPLVETRPGLVPFTFSDKRFADISGTSWPVVARAENGPAFAEAMLATHRGLSGPAMLQISSFWRPGEAIHLSLGQGLAEWLIAAKTARGGRQLAKVLAERLPDRLARLMAADFSISSTVAQWSDLDLRDLAARLENWTLRPTGTEGYRTAEVTVGGIDTAALSSTTMEVRAVPGLFAIGECVDVTGWLGGYNFQWAWASAHAAALALRDR